MSILADLARADRAVEDRECATLVLELVRTRPAAPTSLAAVRAALRCYDEADIDHAIHSLLADGVVVAGRADTIFLAPARRGEPGVRSLIERVAREIWESRGRPRAARVDAWLDAQSVASRLGS
jgi:hypothetical protein